MNKNCKWCGGEVLPSSPSEDECRNCWEMRTCIDMEPYLARDMVLEAIKAMRASQRRPKLYPGEDTNQPLRGSYKGSLKPLEDK